MIYTAKKIFKFRSPALSFGDGSDLACRVESGGDVVDGWYVMDSYGRELSGCRLLRRLCVHHLPEWWRQQRHQLRCELEFLREFSPETDSDVHVYFVDSTEGGYVNFHNITNGIFKVSYGKRLHQEFFNFRSPGVDEFDGIACFVYSNGFVGVDSGVFWGSCGRSSPDDYYNGYAYHVYKDGNVSSNYAYWSSYG